MSGMVSVPLKPDWSTLIPCNKNAKICLRYYIHRKGQTIMKNMESIQNSDPGIGDQASAQKFDSFEEHMKKLNQDIANGIHSAEIVMNQTSLDSDPLPEPTLPEPEPEPTLPEPEPTFPDPVPEPTPDSNLGPNPQESISIENFKSIEKVTPEAKDRILDAVIRRDEASRRRLDAVPEGLPLEEQDEILDKEIAIEKADRELMEDLASDDGTVGSMERKLGKSLQAVADATEIKPEKAPEPGSDEFEETLKDLGL